ncbi:MAG: response regulator receiver modulated metal dependent phosphohydrolase [Clostridia bacterium]|jgi:putative two-component system response regulator|nr:response regulator receiver modulated metal dependent phosphohydrolase [Clostridia bacterium]
MDINLKHSVIMIVDDTPENLILLVAILRGAGYKIKAFPNAKMALESALRTPPDLILLDVMMPELDGYAVGRRLKSDKRFEQIPILFISALSSTFDKLSAFEAGGVDYISKPFDAKEVEARVKAHLTIRLLQKRIEKHNQELEYIVEKQVEEITQSHLVTIYAMIKLAEVRDDDTGKHIERTKTFSKLLAEELQRFPAYRSNIDEKFIEDIYNASPLHDVGKIAIPDKILLKPSRLTEKEFETMKTHTSIGEKYLKEAYYESRNNSFLKMGIEIAGGHHERWDGTGYPKGLAGHDIPLSARIMAVGDVYDALRSKRVYKEPFSHEKSIAIIFEGKGTHFDPLVIEAFSSIAHLFNEVYREMNDKQM